MKFIHLFFLWSLSVQSWCVSKQLNWIPKYLREDTEKRRQHSDSKLSLLPWNCRGNFTGDPWTLHVPGWYFNSYTSAVFNPRNLAFLYWAMRTWTQLRTRTVPRFAFRVRNGGCRGRSTYRGPCRLEPWRKSTWHWSSGMWHGTAFWTGRKTEWRGYANSYTIMFHPVKNQAPNKKNSKEDKKPFENRKNMFHVGMKTKATLCYINLSWDSKSSVWVKIMCKS